MAKAASAEHDRATTPWITPLLGPSSWILSLLAHLALFALLGTLSWVTVARPPLREITVGIVVKDTDEQGTVYEGEAEALRPQSQVPEPSEFLPEDLAEEPSEAAPELPDVELAPIGIVGSPTGDASQLIPVPSQLPAAVGPRARARFFGAEAWGNRFVFAVDRSGSMATNNALGAAKQELLRALNALPAHVQFQVIFYNLNALPLPLNGGKLVYADETNKEQVRRLLRTIAPEGGTDHLPPLRLALVTLKADTVFFLTDADEMTVRDVEDVTRLNRQHATIHAIEFGLGPRIDQNRALQELARRNNGTYRYIDTTLFNQGPREAAP